eukprot:TRINITY_DN2423_c0_g1_i5.p1 TRINITY_DN2423_c0_g1~~TRINITY_DN2423_c0_g1_i5.p1  ORF type:complete len:241 (-),score=22.42 TRINITY_DN2423_c0_g1_i5:20-742(-)
MVLGAGDVIPGWDMGMRGMRVGEVRRITVPPHLAYGRSSVAGCATRRWCLTLSCWRSSEGQAPRRGAGGGMGGLGDTVWGAGMRVWAARGRAGGARWGGHWDRQTLFRGLRLERGALRLCAMSLTLSLPPVAGGAVASVGRLGARGVHWRAVHRDRRNVAGRRPFSALGGPPSLASTVGGARHNVAGTVRTAPTSAARRHCANRADVGGAPASCRRCRRWRRAGHQPLGLRCASVRGAAL